MPTFEHARFIARAIESLLAQSLPHWELIIVDDGSCDGTAQVIGPYLGDQRIRYHRLQENQGLGAASPISLPLRCRLVALLQKRKRGRAPPRQLG